MDTALWSLVALVALVALVGLPAGLVAIFARDQVQRHDAHRVLQTVVEALRRPGDAPKE